MFLRRGSDGVISTTTGSMITKVVDVVVRIDPDRTRTRTKHDRQCYYCVGMWVRFLVGMTLARLFGLLVDPHLDVRSVDVGSVEGLDGLGGVLDLSEPNGAHAALLEDVGPLDISALLEEVLEVSPAIVRRKVSDEQLGSWSNRIFFALRGSLVLASLEGFAVDPSDACHVDGDELVGVLGILRGFELDGGSLGQGLEAIGWFLLDVAVVNQVVLSDLGILAVGGDESDSAVVQPLGDDASLSLAACHVCCFFLVSF